MSGSLDLLVVNAGGAKKRIYQELSKDYSAIEPPFWAALTAGFIRKKGFNVDILDANAENLDFNEAKEKIEKLNPRLTNIVVHGQQPSASTQLMTSIGELCREIKTSNIERKIILTGPHPSALPERTIKEEKCDFVAEGEGFSTLLGILQEKFLQEIPGLWWKEKDKIFSNQRAANIVNLTSELSEVAWDLLPINKYRAHNWHSLKDLSSRNKYASLYTSLGCPFSCSFCCINAPFGKKGYRTWDSDWVLKQIDVLVNDYGVKNVKFIDELFVLKPQHFIPISKGLIERKYELNIWAYARVDTIKEDNLELLRKAGFEWLALGFESGNDRVRKDVSKRQYTCEDMIRVRDKLKKFDINVGGNFIFGLPEDDLESMQETLDLAVELNCEWTNFYCTMAYPGSELYKEAVKNGWKLPDSWAGYSQHSYDCQPLSTKHISAAEVLRFRDEAFKKYFTNQKYLNMIEGKFGAEARRHLEEMTELKLKRKLLGD